MLTVDRTMITFSQALILFALGLTPVYLMLLLLADKEKAEISYSGITIRVLSSLLVIMGLVTFALLNLEGFKSTTFYALFVGIMVAGIIFCAMTSETSLKPSSKVFLLFATLLFLFIIVYREPSGILIGERHGALAQIAKDGFYDAAHPRLHPTYNPFPMDIGLMLALTNITGLSPIYLVSGTIISFATLLVVALLLFSLVRRLTGKWNLGILTILLLAITPPLLFVEHHAKMAGLALTLITIFVVIWRFQSGGSWMKIVTEQVAYTAGIFYHATAGLGMFILASILASGALFKHFVRGRWRDLYKSQIFRLALVTIIVITLARWIYGGGFEPLTRTLYYYALQMVQWEAVTKAPVPLYERRGVSPIQAYAWANPVAMGLALLLYLLIRRRSPCNELIPALAIGGGGFLFIGITSAILRSGFHASMYPGFAFLMPAAAIIVWKLRSRKLLPIITILLVISSIVAIRDPALQPQGLPGLIKAPGAAGEEQYIIALELLSMVPKGSEMRLANELGAALHFLDPYAKASALIYEPLDPKYQRDIAEVQGSLKPYLYTLRLEQVARYMNDGSLGATKINLLMNSGHYITFIKAG